MDLTVYIYIYQNPKSEKSVYIYIFDSIRDSLNKKAVRTLKACELYLFDFDMYSLRHVYVYVSCVF